HPHELEYNISRGVKCIPLFNYYTVRVKDFSGGRDRLQQFLKSQGIATAIYYPLSLHLQEVYKSLGHKSGDFPESENAQQEDLSLPMYPELTQELMEEVVSRIEQALNERLSDTLSI
ncbi:MAG: DegT/DnrJ/EryC1/StrS family aminotransferase, partial [Chloroflexota bacterium]